MPEAMPELETAHVLFMDIVGYSRHTLPDQLRLQDELQQALRLLRNIRRPKWAVQSKERAINSFDCLPVTARLWSFS